MSRSRYRDELIRYEDFTQRVRRHRPSELLPLIAKCATHLIRDEFGHGLPDKRLRAMHPFSLAGAARASLIYGNEYRESGVSIDDLVEIAAAYMAVSPGIEPDEPILPFLVRTAYEQFIFQQAHFRELGRSYALLMDAAIDYGSDVITPEFWNEALGAPLKDFMSVGFLLHAGTLQHDGYYDPGWLDQANFEPILEEISREHIEEVTRRQFFASRDELREIAEAAPEPPGDLRRYAFNPLLARPFLEMPDGRFLAPQPAYTLMRIGPSGLYYIGADHGGNRFTTELGYVFEHYVGMQLRLLPAQVHPEIVYDPDGNKKTVDWIVEFDDLLLLVEAKATPMTAAARVGLDRLTEDVERTIHRGAEQINTTVGLLRDGHGALKHIPSDREMIGLVVTLEPYFMANSGFGDHAETVIPTLACSSSALEQLVAAGIEAPVAPLLLEIGGDPERRSWDLGTALGGVGTETKNPLLDEAWAKFAFHKE